MAIFSDAQRRGLIVLAPLILIVVLLLFLSRHVEIAVSPRNIETCDSVVLKPFNPNEDSFEAMREAGVPVEIAAGIVRWRAYGKVYRIVEDIAMVRGVNDSLYAVLKPFIIIEDRYAPRPRRGDNMGYEYDSLRFDSTRRTRDTVMLQPFLIDTASARYLYLLGFSRRQADVIVRYVKMLGGLRSEEELRDCYVISDSMAARILPYVIFQNNEVVAVDNDRLIEINSADTTLLKSIYGIGSKSAAEIVYYRELLGGYYSVEQLRELKSVTESNYERFFAQICCDSCKISKIDINFAGPKELRQHPYVSSQALRRIVKQRQLKGGWSRIEEMVNDNIFTEEEAKRLAPYLRF